MPPLHPVTRFLCVATSYIDRFVIRSLFFFPATANQGDVSLGRRHRSNKQLSLPFTLPAILWAHSTIWLPVQETEEKKKSIAGINVVWAHRRVGYYTCKKLLEAALVSSLVLCTWWSWYDRRIRQLCYTARNECLSIYVCVICIYKILIIECQGLIHCDSVAVKRKRKMALSWPTGYKD